MPSPDHPVLEPGPRWKRAGLVIGAAIVLGVVLVIDLVSGGDDGPERDVVELTVVSVSGDGPTIESVAIDIADGLPGAAEIRIDASGADRVDVTGDALCAPVAGSESAWLDVEVCTASGELTVSAVDGDDERSAAVVALP